MSIGKRIKSLRTRKGMTIDDLASKLRKNRTTVYRYENGDIENLPLGILNPLAEALDTTPAHLMGWASEEMISTKISDGKEESVYSSVNEIYVRPSTVRVTKENIEKYNIDNYKGMMWYNPPYKIRIKLKCD